MKTNLCRSAKLQEFVGRECREIINEPLSNQNAQWKAVALSADHIKDEKLFDRIALF